MLAQTENNVKIEGILSEINLEETSFKRNGTDVPCIRGQIKIRVNQVINNENVDLEVPVTIFASKFTKDGRENPAYQSAMQVKDEYNSIAATSYEAADRVRITNAQISMNEYYSKTGALISFPRVSANFIRKIKKEEMKPEASFIAVFMVGQAGFETDADGVELPTYKIVGMLPQYGGTVDVVPFKAINKGVIDAVSQYWTAGETVKASGKLNFSSRVETTKVDVDFGDPIEQTRTVNVAELIITGGSSSPLEGEFAIDADEIQTALTVRKAKLDKSKEEAVSGAKANKPKANKFPDLGF